MSGKKAKKSHEKKCGVDIRNRFGRIVYLGGYMSSATLPPQGIHRMMDERAKKATGGD